MSYRKALEALRAYEPRELITNYFALAQWDGTDRCCAVGAIIPETRHRRAHDAYRDADLIAARDAMGLTEDEMSTLMYVNDLYEGEERREERYQRVIAWLEEQVSKEAA